MSKAWGSLSGKHEFVLLLIAVEVILFKELGWGNVPNVFRHGVEIGLLVPAIILWSPRDPGHLAVHAGAALAKGELSKGDGKFSAGKPGELEVEGDSVILGTPMAFMKGNIDDYDF